MKAEEQKLFNNYSQRERRENVKWLEEALFISVVMQSEELVLCPC